VLESLMVAHCDRLIIVAIAFIVLGIFLMRRPDPVGSFGWMTIGWSVVNILIAVPGRINPKVDPKTIDDLLAFNLGLNVAYVAVGITLLVLGNPRVRGAGIAVIVQGVNLLVLDGYLYSKIVNG
jgi:hypothetical protein